MKFHVLLVKMSHRYTNSMDQQMLFVLLFFKQIHFYRKHGCKILALQKFLPISILVLNMPPVKNY